MLGRATDINPETWLFTTNDDLIKLAMKWSVPHVENMVVTLSNMFPIAEELKRGSGRTYLLIDFGT